MYIASDCQPKVKITCAMIFFSHVSWYNSVRKTKVQIVNQLHQPTSSQVSWIPLNWRQSHLQQMTILNIFHCFSEKIRLDISCESSARQDSHEITSLFFL